MKKIFAVLAVFSVIAAALSGCSYLQEDPAADTVSSFIEEADSYSINSNEATAANNVAEADNSSSSTEFDAKAIVDEINVESYTYSTDYSYAAVFVLKNNSDYHCELRMSIDFYDEDDNIEKRRML